MAGEEKPRTEDSTRLESVSMAMSKDSGYAWLVCGAAFCTLFVTLGLHYSCGVIFVALLDSFGESKAKTGTLKTYIPPWKIWLTFTFLPGLDLSAY